MEQTTPNALLLPAARDAMPPLDLDLGDGQQYLKLINNCNEQDPLLSETPLGQWLARVPLKQVPPSQLTQLNLALNVEQLIPTRAGLNRDYRGLAELIGFSGAELESVFKRSHNPTKCLIEAHMQRRVALDQGAEPEMSVQDLLRLLQRIERFDVIDDLMPALVQLAQAAREHELKARERNRRLVACNNQLQQQQQQRATQFSIAQDPQGSERSNHDNQYDAFLCYAPEDQDYANELILMLERHDKRIVTKENLLPGRFEYDALVQMIANECRKVIIILTPNFLHSRECEFQAKFANEFAIKSGLHSKVIPVLYEAFDDSRLPPLIQVISKIDMRANQLQWQLRKLLASLEYDGQRQQLGLGGQSSLREPERNSMHHRLTSHHARSRHFVGGVAASFDETRFMRDDCENGPHGSTSSDQAPAGYCDYQQHLNRRTTQQEAEPIIDLAYSQGSDLAMNMSCHRLGIQMANYSNGRLESKDNFEQQQQQQVSQHNTTNNKMSPASSSSSSSNHHHNPNQLNPFNWYRSFKRKVLTRGESISPSTSSRAVLLQQQHSSSSISRCGSPLLLISSEELDSETRAPMTQHEHNNGHSSQQRSD